MAKGNSLKAFSLEGRIFLGFDNKSLKAANAQISREVSRMQQHTLGAANTFRGLMGASGAAFGAVAGGMALGAASASKFEESFVRVKKTLNISKDVQDVERAFKQISDQLINLSKITPITTDELNEIAAVGGQLGVAATDIVEFTKVIQKLTIATNLGAEDAALAMARLQEITGSSTQELDNLGATLVDLGNNFAATESEIVNSAMQIATATAQIAGDTNNAAVDSLAFATALRAIGQPAQAGATAIVRLMTEAGQAVQLGGRDLELFAQTAGLNMMEFVRLFEVDSTRAIALFIKGLDNMSGTGMTNIEVLQELGLGQVRSRKAILALSKANDLLFDAIETGNRAFIENIALNEEAERRYDTLAMKIQQLKNIVGAGMLAFAGDTDSLNVAKDVVEGMTNITYRMMQNFEGILRVLIKAIPTFMILKTITGQMSANVAQSALAMDIYGTAAKGAGGTSAVLQGLGLAGGKGVEADDLAEFGLRGFRGSQISMADKLAGVVPGFAGGMFGLQTGKARRQSDTARKAYFTARPGADMFMRGIDPEEHFKDAFEKVNEVGGQLFDANNKLIESTVESGKAMTNYYEQVAEMNYRNTSSIRRWATNLFAKKGGRMLGATDATKEMAFDGKGMKKQKNLSDYLNTIYGSGKGKRLGKTFRKSSVLRGMDAGFMQMLEASKLVDEGNLDEAAKVMKKLGMNVPVNELRGLSTAFDIAAAKSLKFAGILKGIVSAFAAIGTALVFVAPLIKMFAQRGAEARGLEEFKNTIFEISNGYREMAGNMTLVSEAQNLLSAEQGIFGGGSQEIITTLEDYIKNQEKAITEASRNLAISVGKSYIEGILLVETEASRGGLSKMFIDMLGEAGMGTEEQIVKQWADPIGRAIQSVVESGEIPTVEEALKDLLFIKDGVLSEFFTGDTRAAIWKGMKTGTGTGPLEFMASMYDGALGDISEFEISQREIFDGMQDMWDKYVANATDAEKQLAKNEMLGAIGRGEFFGGPKFKPAGYQNAWMPQAITSGDVKAFDDYMGGIAKVIKQHLPTISDIDLGKAVLEVMSFNETANSLVGGDWTKIFEKGGSLADTSSDLVVAATEMAEAQLDMLVTAGELTQGQVFDVKGKPIETLKLYSKTMKEIDEETRAATKNVQQQLGVTEEMSLRLAIKMKEAFKAIRKAALELGKPLEEAFSPMETMGSLLTKLRQQRKEIMKFEADLNLLRKRGFEMSADRIMAMGLAGRDVAKMFLGDSGAAQMFENEALKTGPSYAQELGVPSLMIDENYMQDLKNMGYEMTTSFIDGMKGGFPLLRAAFGEMGDEVVDALQKALKLHSPSKVMIAMGKDTALGFVIGLKGSFDSVNLTGMDFAENFVDGVFRGFDFEEKSFLNMVESFGINAYTWLANFMTEGAPGQKWQGVGGGLDVFTASVINFGSQYITQQQRMWSVVTALTNAERARTQALLGVNQAKQGYASQLRQEASLEDRLTRTREKLNKLELEGRVGNVTVDERAGILGNLISLRDMEKRAKGEYTAKEALGIQKKEQEVQTMSRMFDQGVIDQLTFQAAQEELAEMKGEFKTPEDKELFFLQLAQAQATYDKSIEDSLKISDELVSTREEYFRLLDEQENMTLLVKTAQEGYNASLENWVTSDLAVSAAMLNFQNNLVPSQIETLLELQGIYGGVTGQIQGMWEALESGGSGALAAMGITGANAYGAAVAHGVIETIEDYMAGSTQKRKVAAVIPPIGRPTVGSNPLSFVANVPGAPSAPYGNKYGGRHPAKGYAMGGRDYGMRRALVGEYGPEEVRFVPGSGFLVKPLSGGRGKGTVVENLSVNVTGVPVDNASARKAAIQIRKALQRLDKEGNAGGGIRNT